MREGDFGFFEKLKSASLSPKGLKRSSFIFSNMPVFFLAKENGQKETAS
jgi:hypothetical protein